MIVLILGLVIVALGAYPQSKVRAWEIVRNPMTVYVIPAWPFGRKKVVPRDDQPVRVKITRQTDAPGKMFKRSVVYPVRLILESGRHLNLFYDIEPERAQTAAEIADQLNLPLTEQI